MNAKASDALMEAIKIENPTQRKLAVELWVTRWVVLAAQDIRVSDPHPRVIALELAHATRAMVEEIVLSGSEERVLHVERHPDTMHFTIEMTCLRYSLVARPGMLGVAPDPKPKKKRKT